MTEKFLLADDKLKTLGLGDLINRFSCLNNSKNQNATLFFRNAKHKSKFFDLENVISDILKNKNVKIKILEKYQNTEIFESIENGEVNPELNTKIIFSKTELEWTENILNQCGFSRNDKVLAICDNIPGRSRKKMWSQKHWISLIEKVIKKYSDFKVVLLPNFRNLTDLSDEKMSSYLNKKYPKLNVFSFQQWIRNNLQKIIASQKQFGKLKNDSGLTLRQFSAITAILLKGKNRFGIFNDSGPAHLAIASVGDNIINRNIISVNVENMNHYRLRNGGKSFPFGNDKTKTNPEIVAQYINSKIQ